MTVKQLFDEYICVKKYEVREIALKKSTKKLHNKIIKAKEKEIQTLRKALRNQEDIFVDWGKMVFRNCDFNTHF